MSTAATILALALLAQPPAPADDPAARAAGHARSKYLLEVYTAEAAGYTIFRDASRKEKLELRREPVYVWNNRVRDGGQEGAVYVWTDRGRAEVIGTFFSFPKNAIGAGPAPATCARSSIRSRCRCSTCPAAPRPTGGLHGRPASSSPRSPAPRRRPVRPRNDSRKCAALAHEFSARTRDHTGRQWELRLLPQPLYRYESTDPGVPDGAVFAFVTSAGTDPEVILVVEARKPAGGGEPAWHYAAARFTDLDLWVSHKEKVVFTATYISLGGIDQDGKYRYHVFKDRVIPAMGKQP